MLFLRNSIKVSISILFCGCASSSFKLLKYEDHAAEIKVTPDRVLMECEFQFKDNSGDGYGFMMHVLDDANTVLSISQGNVLDKGSCFRRIQKIGKILKTGKSIYIGGIGNIAKPRIKNEQAYAFPGGGRFYENGRNIQFMVIANEQGLCYDAYSGDENPCPREPFSLKNLK